MTNKPAEPGTSTDSNYSSEPAQEQLGTQPTPERSSVNTDVHPNSSAVTDQLDLQWVSQLDSAQLRK